MKTRKPVTRADVTLSDQEIQNFVHNASLATLENVPDDRIPACYTYKKLLVKHLREESVFTVTELAAILTAAARDLLTPSSVSSVSSAK